MPEDRPNGPVGGGTCTGKILLSIRYADRVPIEGSNGREAGEEARKSLLMHRRPDQTSLFITYLNRAELQLVNLKPPRLFTGIR